MRTITNRAQFRHYLQVPITRRFGPCVKLDFVHLRGLGEDVGELSVNWALPGFKECYGAQRRGVGALSEDAYVQDAVWVFTGGLRQVALGVVAEQDIGGRVEVFQLVLGGLAARQVVV